MRDLLPTNGTPLYRATQLAYEKQVAEYDPTRINAVVLLSDGVNDDGEPDDDRDQLAGAPRRCCPTAPRASRPRPCACSRSPTATTPTSPRSGAIAESSQAALYDSSDPRSINKVFVAVVTNF